MISEKDLAVIRNFFTAARSNEELSAFYQANFGPLLSTCEDLWPIARAARRWVRSAPGREAAQAESDLVDALKVLQVSE